MNPYSLPDLFSKVKKRNYQYNNRRLAIVQKKATMNYIVAT